MASVNASPARFSHIQLAALTLLASSGAVGCGSLRGREFDPADTRIVDLDRQGVADSSHYMPAASSAEILAGAQRREVVLSRVAIAQLIARDDVGAIGTLLKECNFDTRQTLVAALTPAQVRIFQNELESLASDVESHHKAHSSAAVQLASIGSEPNQRTVLARLELGVIADEVRPLVIQRMNQGLDPTHLGARLTEANGSMAISILREVVADDPERYFPLLLLWLESDDAKQRTFAALVLTTRGNVDAQQVLLQALETRDALFSPAAFSVLLRSGESPAVGSALNRFFLESPPDAQLSLLPLLIESPCHALSGLLATRFESFQTPDERIPWAMALAQLNHPVAPPFAFQIIGGGYPISGWKLLASYDSPSVMQFALSHLGGPEREEARAYFTRLGPSAIPTLRPLLERETPAPLRLDAALVLGRLGDSSVASHLYSQLFPGDGSSLGGEIAQSLAPCLTLEVGRMMANQIRDTKFYPQFGELIAAMEPEAALVLIRRFVAPMIDASMADLPKLQFRAETVLGIEAALWNPAETAGGGMIRMLHACGEVAVPSLCRLLRHSDESIACRAAWAIGDIRDAWALPALQARALTATGALAERLTVARGRLNDNAVIPDLIRVIKANAGGGATFCAEALTGLRDPRADSCIQAEVEAGRHLPNILVGLRAELDRGTVRLPLLAAVRTQLPRIDKSTAETFAKNFEKYTETAWAAEILCRMYLSPQSEVRACVDYTVKRFTSTVAGRQKFLQYLGETVESEAAEESQKLAASLEQRFRRAERAGILFPLRFSEQSLEALIFCREHQRPVNFPLATLIYNRHDHNGAFTKSSNLIVEELMRAGVWVDYLEVSNPEEFHQAIRRSSGIDRGLRGQIDIFILAAHGSRDDVQLSVNSAGGAVNLSRADILALRNSDVWSGFAPGFQGLLFACSVGWEKDAQPNLTNGFAEVASGEDAFIAPTVDAYGIERLKLALTGMHGLFPMFDGRSRVRIVDIGFGRVSDAEVYRARR